jgi:hypothetical protein
MCERDGADCTLQPKPANTAASKQPAPSLSHLYGILQYPLDVSHIERVSRLGGPCFFEHRMAEIVSRIFGVSFLSTANPEIQGKRAGLRLRRILTLSSLSRS